MKISSEDAVVSPDSADVSSEGAVVSSDCEDVSGEGRRSESIL